MGWMGRVHGLVWMKSQDMWEEVVGSRVLVSNF